MSDNLYSGGEDQEVFNLGKVSLNPWEFRISKCKKCGRTPTVIKNFEIEGKGRYKIKCCNVEILENTETACICTWNRINLEVPILKFNNGGFSWDGSGEM